VKVCAEAVEMYFYTVAAEFEVFVVEGLVDVAEELGDFNKYKDEDLDCWDQEGRRVERMRLLARNTRFP
jgi:hypothetical protein